MWFYILLIITALALGYALWFKQKSESFNEHSGTFCGSCANKTPNQCAQCFNCGFCVDKWGNGQCIGGDADGGFNYEKCALWYHGDPWSRMKQNNANYKCSYGPIQGNRIIGVNPDPSQCNNIIGSVQRNKIVSI